MNQLNKLAIALAVATAAPAAVAGGARAVVVTDAAPMVVYGSDAVDWNAIDTNRDGVLSSREISRWREARADRAPLASSLRPSTSVVYEGSRYVVRREPAIRVVEYDALLANFDAIDRDRDGRLSRAELARWSADRDDVAGTRPSSGSRVVEIRELPAATATVVEPPAVVYIRPGPIPDVIINAAARTLEMDLDGDGRVSSGEAARWNEELAGLRPLG